MKQDQALAIINLNTKLRDGESLTLSRGPGDELCMTLRADDGRLPLDSYVTAQAIAMATKAGALGDLLGKHLDSILAAFRKQRAA